MSTVIDIIPMPRCNFFSSRNSYLRASYLVRVRLNNLVPMHANNASTEAGSIKTNEYSGFIRHLNNRSNTPEVLFFRATFCFRRFY